MGLEFHLAAARWLGHGGATGFHDEVLEAMTAVPAAAALTENILGLATGHVTYSFHPLHYAKFGATADHISGGRWGVNVITGWVAEEQPLFGREFPDHDRRYDMTDEFVTLMKHAWSRQEPFSFEGDYYRSYGVSLRPKPLRSPRPFPINAGSSPAGIDFAARQCDWLFCLGDLAVVRPPGGGRSTRPRRDSSAACRVLHFRLGARGGHQRCSGTPAADVDLRTLLGPERYVGTAVGLGGRCLLGDAEAIAARLRELHETGGQPGIMLSFLDYQVGLDRLQRNVLPVLERMEPLQPGRR